MLKLLKLANEEQTASYPAPITANDDFAADSYLLTVKGAPEILLPRCGYVSDPAGGAPLPLTLAARVRMMSVQERWAAQGRRVLLLAKRILPHDTIPTKFDLHSEEFAEYVDELNAELVIVGLVGLIDPLKPDIVQTVQICRGAGIRFFVVTGKCVFVNGLSTADTLSIR